MICTSLFGLQILTENEVMGTVRYGKKPSRDQMFNILLSLKAKIFPSMNHKSTTRVTNSNKGNLFGSSGEQPLVNHEMEAKRRRRKREEWDM